MSEPSVSPAKLFDAAASGNVDLVKKQLDGGVGVDVDDPERGSMTALMLSSARGHRDVAQLLLEQGADKNKANATGKTALHWSAMRGHYGVVKLLLEHQVKVEVMDQDGNTPLTRAVAKRKWGVVTLLLDHGADPSRGLRDAVMKGYPDLARLLRDERVKANVPPEDLVPELERAVERGDQYVVRALLEHGVPANTRGVFGLTPLHRATRSVHSCTAIVAALVQHGALLDVTDDRGRTALCHAALENRFKIGAFLLERGADPNVCDAHGASPLHYAVKSRGLNDDSWRRGRRAVYVTRLLLRYGADRSLVDNNGHTARDLAPPHVEELLDTYFPIKLQLQQLLLGLRGPTPSSLTRFASHPTFEPKVLPFIAAFLSGKGSNAFNEHQRAAERGHEDDSSSSSSATSSSALPTSSAAKKSRLS